MNTWIGAYVSQYLPGLFLSNHSMVRFTAILTSRFILDLHETEASLSPNRTTYDPSTLGRSIAFEYPRPSISHPFEEARLSSSMSDIYSIVMTETEKEDPFDLWRRAVAHLDIT